MELVSLGKTGLGVSRLCFGTLTMGPLQANLPLEYGADLMVLAFNLGVNFVDTAEIYETYSYIKRAIQIFKKRPIISTKSYAYTRLDAKRSLEKALSELTVDYIDMFLLHEQESEFTLKGHREALEFYLDAKQRGLIRAVGISTHHIAAVNAASETPEIDVIHPIINKEGVGIVDGTLVEMEDAIKRAYRAGKGIYSMKALGGGGLINSYEESLKYMMDFPYVHSIAMGMQTEEEVIKNVCMFENTDAPKEVEDKLQKRRRLLHIEDWCIKCEKCARRCKQGAIKLIDGEMDIDHKKCVLCGYCTTACKNGAIKIY